MRMDNLRVQTELHIHVGMRELPKRYIGIHVMFFTCWLAGYTWEIAALWLYVTAIEMISCYVVRRAPPAVDLKPSLIIGLMCASFFGSIGYYAPVVLLAFQADIAFYVAAVIWIMAAMSAATTMYNVAPAFYWTVNIPGFLSALFLIASGAHLTLQPSPVSYWIVPVIVLVMHAANNVMLKWDYLDTDKEMNRLRAESLNRLRQLEYTSKHDDLTHLINRSEFDRRLQEYLATPERTDHVFVVMIDLNDFKAINDTYGHRVGDVVLTSIASRLKGFDTKNFAAARLGGDEFGILIRTEQNSDHVMALATTLAAAIRQPIHHEGLCLAVTASVGVAHCRNAGSMISDICSAADQAMYLAKSQRITQPVLYDPATFGPRTSLLRQNRLKAAIRDGEIGPFYQPKIRVSDGAHVGFEALARWQHPEQGILMPADFLPEIKEFGLLADLTRTMLVQCLKDIDEWRHMDIGFGKISVNIPEVVLATSEGLNSLMDLFAGYDDCYALMTFEITEDVVIARSGNVIQNAIGRIGRAGIAISLDDFGTGYASFQHLRQLRFDEMKIDTSFVAGLGSDPVANVIVEGFLSIAKGLGAEVVAEGVETQDQLDHLKTLGCQYAQGYLFGRAMPAEAATKYMLAATDPPGASSPTAKLYVV